MASAAHTRNHLSRSRRATTSTGRVRSAGGRVLSTSASTDSRPTRTRTLPQNMFARHPPEGTVRDRVQRRQLRRQPHPRAAASLVRRHTPAALAVPEASRRAARSVIASLALAAPVPTLSTIRSSTFHSLLSCGCSTAPRPPPCACGCSQLRSSRRPPAACPASAPRCWPPVRPRPGPLGGACTRASRS